MLVEVLDAEKCAGSVLARQTTGLKVAVNQKFLRPRA
jgi:hypothetical protein